MSLSRPDLLAACSATLAAGVHGWIFTQESILFARPNTQRMLGVPAENADAVRLWAFHQGIYKLLLGGTALGGATALLTGNHAVGVTLIGASSAAMVIAAGALIAADPHRSRVPGLLAQALPAGAALLALTWR